MPLLHDVPIAEDDNAIGHVPDDCIVCDDHCGRAEFEMKIHDLAQQGEPLTAEHLDEAISIASLPDQVRGYEDLKLARAETYRSELARRIARFASR